MMGKLKWLKKSENYLVDFKDGKACIINLIELNKLPVEELLKILFISVNWFSFYIKIFIKDEEIYSFNIKTDMPPLKALKRFENITTALSILYKREEKLNNGKVLYPSDSKKFVLLLEKTYDSLPDVMKLLIELKD